MFEDKTFCTGATFVPKQGGLEEDDGWIITFVHNEDTNISQVNTQILYFPLSGFRNTIC